MQKKPQKPPQIEDLYPDLPPKERAEAQANLQAYFNLIWRIFNRLKREGRLDEITNSHLRHEWEKRNRDEEI